MNYREAIAFIEGFIDYEKMRTGVKYDTQHFHLERFAGFLERLGNPQNSYKIIHLAGTKGKGSTAAMLHYMLAAAGVRTGMYTSPHLASYCERVMIDGQPVSEQVFAGAMSRVKACWEDSRYEAERNYRTTFELLTAAAFCAFEAVGVEWCVLETGLGGRLDATNVAQSAIAVITCIGLDHAEILGPDVEHIAAEKAGIIKPGRPVVLAPQLDQHRAAVERIIGQRCLELDCRLWRVERELKIGERQPLPDSQAVEIIEPRLARGRAYKLALTGKHQADNMRTALVALKVTRQGDAQLDAAFREHPHAVEQGLKDVKWPARFETIRSDPPLILDAAHCEISFAALADTLREQYPGCQPRLILGLMRERNPLTLLRTMVERFPQLIVAAVDLPSPRATPAADLAAAVRTAYPGLTVEQPGEMTLALQQAHNAAHSPLDVTIVAGSLYHLSSARQAAESIWDIES
ncbi:bifunctional folylpolyglutamate synthase/dihydrofolate synthase [Candidatus Sumerlaeota bacterium]|nr:bifunctional folylpolyglutamate synthase/dihydrofolate synthase [Candidatus Sumerlaeota bacterium]